MNRIRDCWCGRGIAHCEHRLMWYLVELQGRKPPLDVGQTDLAGYLESIRTLMNRADREILLPHGLRAVSYPTFVSCRAELTIYFNKCQAQLRVFGKHLHQWHLGIDQSGHAA